MSAMIRNNPTLILTLCVVTGITILCGACTKEKRVEIVLVEELGMVLQYRAPDASNSIPAVVGFPALLADILTDNGYSRDDVVGVHIASGHYGSSDVQGGHDWTVTGQIQARRMDGVVAGPTRDLVRYEDQSMEAALNQRLQAPLAAEGVALIKQAIDDYLAGDSPIVEFTVDTDSVSPNPSVIDPMAFDLKAWLTLHIVIEQRIDVPEPF